MGRSPRRDPDFERRDGALQTDSHGTATKREIALPRGTLSEFDRAKRTMTTPLRRASPREADLVGSATPRSPPPPNRIGNGRKIDNTAIPRQEPSLPIRAHGIWQTLNRVVHHRLYLGTRRPHFDAMNASTHLVNFLGRRLAHVACRLPRHRGNWRIGRTVRYSLLQGSGTQIPSTIPSRP